MRTAIIALFLTQAVAAFAQRPVIGPEVVSDPLGFSHASVTFAAPAVALAKDHDGVAVAWTMQNANAFDRVYVARLDASGRAFGAVHEMPVANTSEEFDAAYPSIAVSPSGEGFVVAWLETPRLPRPSVRLSYVQLGRDLSASAPVALMTAGPGFSAPALARSGATTWVAMGGLAWEIHPDGSAGVPLGGEIAASDMDVGPANSPTLVASQTSSVTKEAGCTCPQDHFPGFVYCPDQCKVFSTTNTYSVQLVPLFGRPLTRTYAFTSDAQPALRSDDRDALLVWFDGMQSSGGNVVAQRLQSALGGDAAQPLVLGGFNADAGPTRADIAADGRRYVVVWRVSSPAGSHDIVGAAIDDGGDVTPLKIATSDADERDPAVLSLGGGVFLVGYEKNTGGERRIAGRFVTFARRQRAVR